MSGEEWRPAVGFPGYAVSNMGRVTTSLRRRTPHVLSPGSKKRGHRFVGLTLDGERKYRTVHTLVMDAFVGPCPPGLQVRHLDGDATNNVLGNLAYGTASENMYDRIRHGTHHEANKTHCPSGHPYDEANTRVIPSRPRARYCRACMASYRPNPAALESAAALAEVAA